MTIRAIPDAYDVAESTTFLQLASCHDRRVATPLSSWHDTIQP